MRWKLMTYARATLDRQRSSSFICLGDQTVAAAHETCDRIEAALKAVVKDCVVTIHVEPEFKAKHSGIVVLIRRETC